MRKIQKLLSMLMVITVMTSFLLLPSAKANAVDVLTPYREKLAELNMEMGTSYAFPSEEQLAEEGESYADLVEFYTSMTMAEFRDYVLDAYQKSIASVDQTSSVNRAVAAGNQSLVIDVAEPYSYSSTQRYYYTITNYNNLYIKATCYTGGGERYSSVNSYGESHTAYPYFKPTAMDKSFNTGKTKVICIFHCVRYLAKNLLDTEMEAIIIQFTAGGGNLYKA